MFNVKPLACPKITTVKSVLHLEIQTKPYLDPTPSQEAGQENYAPIFCGFFSALKVRGGWPNSNCPAIRPANLGILPYQVQHAISPANFRPFSCPICSWPAGSEH